MTDDKELIARLRGACYLAFDDGTNDFGTAPEAADRIEALTAERDVLRSALNRIRPIPERILRGIPVRDLAETLAEADSALIKGESHE